MAGVWHFAKYWQPEFVGVLQFHVCATELPGDIALLVIYHLLIFILIKWRVILITFLKLMLTVASVHAWGRVLRLQQLWYVNKHIDLQYHSVDGWKVFLLVRKIWSLNEFVSIITNHEIAVTWPHWLIDLIDVKKGCIHVVEVVSLLLNCIMLFELCPGKSAVVWQLHGSSEYNFTSDITKDSHLSDM